MIHRFEYNENINQDLVAEVVGKALPNNYKITKKDMVGIPHVFCQKSWLFESRVAITHKPEEDLTLLDTAGGYAGNAGSIVFRILLALLFLMPLLITNMIAFTSVADELNEAIKKNSAWIGDPKKNVV